METKQPLGPPELPDEVAPPEPPEPEEIPEDEAMDEPDELNEHVNEPGDPDGVHAAEQIKEWQAEHPLTAETEPKHRRRWLRWLIVLLVIVAAGFGAFWYGGHKADKPVPKASAKPSQNQSQTATPKTVDTPTKHYDSVTYTLGFDYPQTWAVTDTATKLTVASPNVQLSLVGGTTAEGHVVVTIQNQQTSIAGYPANGALAVLLSDKLTYKQPTTIQRAQTYLSYLGYSKTNGLDALYITGDNGYQQGQQIPMSDIIKGNPLVSVTFQSCTSADCSTGTPTYLTLLASTWPKTQSAKDITNLLESLQLD